VVLSVFLGVAALSLVACGPGLKAPQPSDGGTIAVHVAFDRNIPEDAEADKVTQRNQVSDWMEADLQNMFRKYKYDIMVIDHKDQFNPGTHKFLLDVKVLSYNPGSKGARVAGALMGGWAGQAVGQSGEARLAVHYKLVGEEGKVIEADLNEGSGSSDWQTAVRKVNQLILKGTAKSLQKLYKGK
jgi:hypothetical protein